ncbi:MAG: hypothetical protein R6X18_05525 [Chloroflexota bacterium]|jgi:hypothetical protein
MHIPPSGWSTFDDPATYWIAVQGALALDLSDRLEGMAITREVTDDGAVISILAGELADQSALASVLLSLYELHVTLISIEQIPARAPPIRPASENPEA